MSVCHVSILAWSFRMPRGHKRSTRRRMPSDLEAGSYTRFNVIIDMIQLLNSILVIAS